MTFYALVALINAVSSFVVGATVAIKKHNNWSIRVFAALLFNTSFWSFAYFIWQLSTNDAFALQWARILSMISFFIPIIYTHWVFLWLNLTKFVSRKILLIVGYITATILSFLTLFTNLVIPYVMKTPFFDYWPKGGSLYFMFPLVLFGGYITILLIELFHTYAKEQGLRRYQIKYVIIGVFLSCIGGATNFPLWYNVPVPPIGNIFVTIGMLALFYGFVRYRLMDLRSISIEILIYLVDAIYVYAFFYIVAMLLNGLFGNIFSQASYLTTILITPIFLYFLFKIDKKTRTWFAKHLFMQMYEYQDTITQMAANLNQYLDLNKIIDLIVDTTKDTMHLDRAGILLVDPDTKPQQYKIAKVIGFDINNGISLVEDNFLTRHLQETKRALVRDELNALSRDTNNVEEQKSILNLEQQMIHIEASMCIPLMSRGKIIGIIVLGSKISGDAYTEEDLNLLTTLTNQAGLAIENAWLYKKVQSFYETLAERVDKQTEQIRNEKTELEELVQIKNEFLRVVNHQLNTPISIIKNSLSMMDEGSLDQTEGMENIRVGFSRIERTVSDFWKAFDLEGTSLSTKLCKTDITAIIQDQVAEKKKLKEVSDRKLTLTIQKPDFSVPLLWCNTENIRHVISNLMDNAVSYTEKGDITISYELAKDKKNLTINITDTGFGLSLEDKAMLFNKFSRGSGATALMPNGSGLGLYIAKKLTKNNHGTLSYKSDGHGKGSTFSVTLAVYTNQEELATK